MKLSKYRPRALGLLLLSLLTALALGATAGASPSSAPLASAANFAVLAGAGITNAAGQTTVSGDIGSYTTATITGTASLALTGTNHGGDPTTQQAKSDLGAAYDNAAAASPGTATPITGNLGGGQVLTPGVYNTASSIGLGGVLTLDALGDGNAVFIFQAGSTLTTASASRIDLVNNAQSCNVYWQVGSSATLGTGSSFVGNILAMSDITVTSGVSVDGRVLARDGAVTLDTDSITRPACVPTAVATQAFTAQSSKNGVSLRWKTASGIDILGFNLYGQHGTKRVRINPALIASTSTITNGHAYRYDTYRTRQAAPSRYWLQVVHLDGSRSWTGSTRARAAR